MCGIIGMQANHEVAEEIYNGLTALQHRGQDSAGIMTFNGQFHLKKGNGMVRDVFRTKNILRLKGDLGIGHVRYPTAGCSDAEEAQPFYVNAPFGISLVHNGNLTNYFQLLEQIRSVDLRRINTTSDSEILLNVFAHEMAMQKGLQNFKPNHVFETVKSLYKRTKGSYSAVGIIADKGLFAFRDPFGIRPLVLGSKEHENRKEYIVASEDVAIRSLGYAVERDIEPGEVIFVDHKGVLHTKKCVKGDLRPCIFEYVYLARPDSMLDKVSVYKSRLRMGEMLAKQVKDSGLHVDTVMPIPDTSRSTAITLAHDLGVKYREGYVKNRYIGRTFIMPGQRIRKRSVYFKLNTIPLEFKDKNVLLVDDSIVRGNTSRHIIDMARAAGAKNVYFASACPEIRYQCVFGVDMPSRKELIAHELEIEKIAEHIGADALFYQKLPDLVQSVKRGNPKIKQFCTACMNGDYIEQYVDQEVLKLAEASRGDKNEEDEEDQLI